MGELGSREHRIIPALLNVCLSCLLSLTSTPIQASGTQASQEAASGHHSMYLQSQLWGGRERRSPGAHWLASLDGLVSRAAVRERQ